MKNRSRFLLLPAIFCMACSTPIGKIFDKKTPHEEYAEKLDDKDLDKTADGLAWQAASQAALEAPVSIALPYRQQGFFHADKPRAMGLQFTARPGELLRFSLTRKSGSALPIYADLFRQSQTSAPVLSADTGSTSFSFAVEEAGAYVLRLQPELFRSGEYTLSISIAPSIGFPVSGGKARVASVWGDRRDGGRRRHEGIDIFAPKLTPAVAAADGIVTGVRTGGIGGKTVWLRPEGKTYTLYYAHLDRQLVHEGQRVKKGDVIGLVGNTGNARHTPSHLHFGVYTAAGPLDPLPFVDRDEKAAPALESKALVNLLKLKKAQVVTGGPAVKGATSLVPLAVDAQGYLAEAPDGRRLQLPFSAVEPTKEPVKRLNDIAVYQSQPARKS